jgi:hypothetical protein
VHILDRSTWLACAAWLAASGALAAPTASNGPTAQLEGEWRGRSLCVTTTRPACTDETVVYSIKRHAAGTEAFDVKADKIVDGKRLFMGNLACSFEASRQQLLCPMGTGKWQFRWDGRQLVGVLADPSGPFRVIRVDKVRP